MILKGLVRGLILVPSQMAIYQPRLLASTFGSSGLPASSERRQAAVCQFRCSQPALARRFASTSAAAYAASSKSLYTDPALYDRVFSAFRDYEKQVDFLIEVFRKHNDGRDPQSFSELGCGPARHAILLTQKGLKGYGVDDSDPMLQHAAAKAAEAGVNMQCINADFRETVVPEGAKVDLVLMLLGTATHLHSNADARACFAAVARSLNPSGLFITETVHPEDLFGGYLDVGDVWEVEKSESGEKLTVHYGKEGDEFNPWTQLMDRSVEVVAHRNGKDVKVSNDLVRQRYFTPTELDQLAHSAGLTTVATHGQLELPFMTADDGNSIAFVAVMQKPDGQ